MAETIKLPDGSTAPAWATEQTMKDLLKVFKESRLFKKDAARPGSPDEDNPLDKPGKAMADTIFKLSGNKQLGALGSAAADSAKAFGTNGLAGGLGLFGKGLGLAAESAGTFAPALQGASVIVTQYAKLMGDYLNMIGKAIDVGLGFSSNLGDSATVAGRAGVSLNEFYKAVGQTEGTYRALGTSAMEAAKNFGTLQSSVRSTYGTFGMSNGDMAEATAGYVKLVAQTGLRGQAATEAASEAYGKSMEQMRKISIATGVSFGKLQGTMKDLIASPIIIAGINKFGTTTEQATERLAKGAAGFEAVFGKLGADLYKQMAEAEAAGLSIINTTLGAELAPFTDLGALTKFNKMMQDGSGTAAEMAEAQRTFLQATDANLPTLRLLAQQGNAAAAQLLQLYNSTKQTTIMSQAELDGLASKKRAEEGMLTVQNKISAAYNNLTAKLFGFLDVIPSEAFEALGSILGGAIEVVGYFATGLAAVVKWVGPIVGGLAAVVGVIAAVANFGAMVATATGFVVALFNPIGLTIAAIVAIGVAIDNWGSILDIVGDAWESSTEWVTGVFKSTVGAISSAFTAITDTVSNFTDNLFDLISSPFRAFSDWLKDSWLGKKIFGGAENKTDPAVEDKFQTGMARAKAEIAKGGNSTTVMDSVPQNAAGSVKTATTAKYADRADIDRRTAELTNTHLESIAKSSEQSVDHQSTTAKNTANTADAVNNSSNNY